MRKKILLFDFDGVIVDTFQLCLDINRKLDGPLSAEDYRRRFEGNIYEYAKKHDGDKKEDWDKFFKYYNPGLLQLDLVEGIQETIQKLHEEYILVIVSSTINSPIKEYLEKHALTQYFDVIFGADVHKNKIEKIKMVFKKYRAKPNDCLFITDTLGDMVEAEKTGVEALGVSWGYHSKETLQKGKSIAIVDKPEDIISVVNKYFTRN